MIKIEHTEVVGWEAAIRGMRANGYRRTRNERYEAFASNRCKTISLGTYDTIDEAKEAVFNYRANRLISGVEAYGLNINDGIVYENNYIVFKNGMIFNLHGERMIGCVDRGGYRHGIFNGHNRSFHKIIADCFIPNDDNLRDINHINGDKSDITLENLERTTHSDNIIHAYRTGLLKKYMGESHHAHKLTAADVKYIRSVYSKRDPNYGAVALANKFGVDRTTIHDVINKKTWRSNDD